MAAKKGPLSVWTDFVEGENGAKVYVVMVGDRLISIVRNEVQADLTKRQLKAIIEEAIQQGEANAE